MPVRPGRTRAARRSSRPRRADRGDRRRRPRGRTGRGASAVDGTFTRCTCAASRASTRPTRRWPRSSPTRPSGPWPSATGSIVGFRFPDYAQGIDVAGYHLHFISDDRTIGGHVIDATLQTGALLVDGAHELHLEVPAGIVIGDADTRPAKAAAIRAVEGGR